MSSYVLFIFEGKVTEQNIANNLCKYILNEDDKVILRASYGFNVYQLHKEISKDKYFDTYGIIVEQLKVRENLRPEEIKVLDIEDPSKISDIYLFFDYDCHCSNADDIKLAEMLETFNDPQDFGLLCVSYPMVEAIRHQKNTDYQEELYPRNQLNSYKNWVKKECELDKRYHNWGLYDSQIWVEIIKQHLARANFLVNDTLSLPESILKQDLIFYKQQDKHFEQNNVAVISSFPLMLHDYFGKSLMERFD